MGKVIFGKRVLDTAQIEERSRRAMSALAALGIGEGDAVALLLRNDIAFLEASLAISRLGACTVPINWHAKPDEIRHVLHDSGAKAVIAHGDLVPALVEAAITGIAAVVVTTPAEIIEAYELPAQLPIPARMQEWEALLAAQPPFEGASRRPRGSIVYTSGTTGLPKGIERETYSSPAEEQRQLQSLLETFGTRPGVRSLICGPLYHSMQNANMRAAYNALGDEGLMVIELRFDAERLLRRVEQYGVTQILMVPVMFVRLIRLPEDVRRRYDLSSLEWVVHSAAPCPVELKRQIIDWFGPVVNEFYAASELGAVTLINSADSLRKPGSVGRPLPGCTVKVLDAHGRELPPGTEGEIAAVNHAYPDFSYRGQPEARRALDRGGLVATGDIGCFDEEGFLFLSGRRNDMVISGGVNIFPAEIEAVMLEHPAIADCAVFGIPDEEYGEALAAHVQRASGGVELSENELRDYLAARLPGFKVPRVIRFEQALPREDSGKIMKRRLRQPYWARAGRRP